MRVGFIGLGNVGSKLAGTLLRNGTALTVMDLDAVKVAGFTEAGAASEVSAAALMAENDVVITCLPRPEISAQIVEGPGGLLEAMAPGKIWLEMSTTDAALIARLALRVEAAGGQAVDCPVSGGCHRAASGNISIFAGCERPTFERVLPLLTLMARRVLHTGAVGSASTLKVITNYLATANLVSCAEALTVAKGAGLDLSTAYEAIRISSGTSFVHETESQVILNGSRDISFTMDLVAKDIGLFQAVADRAGVPVEINPLLIAMFEDAMARFGPRELSPNIIRRLEEATGLDVTAPGFPAEMTDDEPEERGAEVIAARA